MPWWPRYARVLGAVGKELRVCELNQLNGLGEGFGDAHEVIGGLRLCADVLHKRARVCELYTTAGNVREMDTLVVVG